jgi:hypothetical protein
MFLREKFDSEGMQSREDILHEDATSLTAAVPFIFCIASIAAQEHRHVLTADALIAYLHADTRFH